VLALAANPSVVDEHQFPLGVIRQSNNVRLKMCGGLKMPAQDI
jgi:hypothetical protein